MTSVTTTNAMTAADTEVLRDALGLLKDREQVAERLLESSAKHSYDPDTALDWDAPLEDGKWFWPPELVSLYDTPCGGGCHRSASATCPGTRPPRWPHWASGSRSS